MLMLSLFACCMNPSRVHDGLLFFAFPSWAIKALFFVIRVGQAIESRCTCGKHQIGPKIGLTGSGKLKAGWDTARIHWYTSCIHTKISYTCPKTKIQVGDIKMNRIQLVYGSIYRKMGHDTTCIQLYTFGVYIKFQGAKVGPKPKQLQQAQGGANSISPLLFNYLIMIIYYLSFNSDFIIIN